MADELLGYIQAELADIRQSGLYKNERILLSPQQTRLEVADGEVLNFCANNYLGLANHPELIEAGNGRSRSPARTNR